jgi:four helix bundle protein
MGSAFELETHLLLAVKLNFIATESVDQILAELHQEQRQINALISKIKDDQ